MFDVTFSAVNWYILNKFSSDL